MVRGGPHVVGRRATRLEFVNRRAKIVCTLGPAVDSPEAMRELVAAGMDVARLNFSHGSHAEHEQRYNRVREAAAGGERPVGILADLQGPKIRLGRFIDSSVMWANGEVVVITSDEVDGTHDRVSCTYRRLPAEVRPGDRLLIDDGKVAVEILDVTSNDIRCVVVEGGAGPVREGRRRPALRAAARRRHDRPVVRPLTR
jgi:pyruvate kinase